jgi:protein-tyrosine phosphatase
VFFPLLIYTTVVWQIIRVFSREPAHNTVTEQLTVGRRLLASELEGKFDNIVDLTAEFPEPYSIRRSPSYWSFPILDGGAPKPEALRWAIATLRPGRTYVHCAQGHGRTGLFALAVLLTSGVARDVEDGLRLLSAARPGIRLNREQRRCIEIYAQNWRLMSTWRRLYIPPICERMLGFSVPQDGEVLVVSYGGTHLLRLGPEVTVESDHAFVEYDIYDPETGLARYRGKEYRIIGQHGGSPLLDSPRGETLVLDTEAEALSVVQNGETVFSMPYKNFSGDWAAATFSPDGRYVVLGCPHGFDFMILEREATA